MAPEAEVPADLVGELDDALAPRARSAADAAAPAEMGKVDLPKEETWWVNGAFVVAVHLAAAVTVACYRPTNPWLWALVPGVWWPAMFGISAGYHRLWSHRAFKASWLFRVVVMLCGTNGLQGSIKWWVLRHRLHHRFTDTADDPYSSKRGFFFSHMGWIFTKPHYAKMRLIDARDLNADSVVRFQHRYYVPLALLVCFALPSAIGAAMGDALGGLLIGGFVGRVLIWHATFCINSVAHWMGEKTYAADISARSNVLCALMTNGEGYHNFHHAFPRDYRNGVHWYDYDPTKWGLSVAAALGLVWDLKRSDVNEMRKARLEVREQALAAERAQLQWGAEAANLPTMTIAKLRKAVDLGELLVVLDGYVLNVGHFVDDHPGGEQILRAFVGKDASKAFHGGMNRHTRAAENLARMFRIARLESSSSSSSSSSS